MFEYWLTPDSESETAVMTMGGLDFMEKRSSLETKIPDYNHIRLNSHSFSFSPETNPGLAISVSMFAFICPSLHRGKKTLYFVLFSADLAVY